MAGLVPGLRYDLMGTDVDMTDAEYVVACLTNCFVVFVLSSGLFFALLYRIQAKELNYSLMLSLVLGLSVSLLFFIPLIRYPAILAGKKAEQVDKNLIFALKDISLQVSSGVSLYNALVNISKSGYGATGKEFEKVAKAVNTGTPLASALEKMAVESKSEYLRKTVWQLVNTLKAGASLKGALQAIINDLTADQRARISNYAKELSIWSLVYMLFAVAIPTIGSTMMIVLSSFAGIGVTKGVFIAFLVIVVIVQCVLIGFVKTRRPIVHL
ncbi:MAG: type II secretion system F family protein [Nanoarchaeota archaeon]|nr:type II secretion system F family protein [Nanoarchaeota archaeon]